MSDLRSRYITMCNHKTLDASFLYDYAIHNGFKYSFEDFLIGWQMSNINLDILYENLDKEYNLMSLYNSNGVFIKVI